MVPFERLASLQAASTARSHCGELSTATRILSYTAVLPPLGLRSLPAPRLMHRAGAKCAPAHRTYAVGTSSPTNSIVCFGPVNQFFTDRCQYTHSSSIAAGTTRIV